MSERQFARKQFSSGDDILLLKQANLLEPWKEKVIMTAWDDIARTLRSLPQFGVDKDGKACRARFHLLVRHRRDQNSASLRKSGTEEEYEEKEQILDDIIEKMDSHAAYVAAEKQAKAEKARELENSGELLRAAALGEITLTPAPSKAASDVSSSVSARSSGTKRKLMEIFMEGIQGHMEKSREAKKNSEIEQSEFKMKKLEILQKRLDLDIENAREDQEINKK
jgi:hypothetical protein